jgi:hypothetical protein
MRALTLLLMLVHPRWAAEPKVSKVQGERVEVSDRLRSVTNPPARLFASSDAGRRAAVGVSCGRTTCAVGEICCNASCGICTPPDGFCTEQFCGPIDAGR